MLSGCVRVNPLSLLRTNYHLIGSWDYLCSLPLWHPVHLGAKSAEWVQEGCSRGLHHPLKKGGCKVESKVASKVMQNIKQLSELRLCASIHI